MRQLNPMPWIALERLAEEQRWASDLARELVQSRLSRAMRDPHSPSGHATFATLVTLRILDDWIAERPVPASAIRPIMRAAERAPALSKVRDAFAAFAKAVTAHNATPDEQTIVSLIACIEALHASGEMENAVRLYRSAIRFMSNQGNVRRTVDLCHRLGDCLARAGSYAEALETYKAGQQIALASDCVEAAIRLQIAQGQLSIAMGSCIHAEVILHEAFRGAQAAGQLELAGLALYARGLAVAADGYNPRAVTYWQAALSLVEDSAARDEIRGAIESARAAESFAIGLPDAC